MLVTGNELHDLISSGVINAHPDHVNASSIDITMGSTLLVEKRVRQKSFVNILDKNNGINFEQRRLLGSKTDSPEQFYLEPGQCVLASSVEIFNLPNCVSAEYKLKSSMARNFLEHLNAGWCDAGWNGSTLTLELKNMSQYHTLILTPGMKIGQVIFFKHNMVPNDLSYAVKGQYNGDKGVTKSKGCK